MSHWRRTVPVQDQPWKPPYRAPPGSKQRPYSLLPGFAALTPSQQAQVMMLPVGQRMRAERMIAGYKKQKHNQTASNKKHSKSFETGSKSAAVSSKPPMKSKQPSLGYVRANLGVPQTPTDRGDNLRFHSGLLDRLAHAFTQFRLRSSIPTVLEIFRERAVFMASRAPLGATGAMYSVGKPPDYTSTTVNTLLGQIAANDAGHVATVGVFWPRRSANSVLLFDPGYGNGTVAPRTSCGGGLTYPSTTTLPAAYFPNFIAASASGPTSANMPFLSALQTSDLVKSICLGGAIRFTVKRGTCTLVMRPIEPTLLTPPISTYNIISTVLSAGGAYQAGCRIIPLMPGQSYVYVPSFLDQTNLGFGSSQSFYGGIGDDSTWGAMAFSVSECSWSQECPEVIIDTIVSIQSSTTAPLQGITSCTGVASSTAADALSSTAIDSNGGSNAQTFASVVDSLGKIASTASSVAQVVRGARNARGGVR